MVEFRPAIIEELKIGNLTIDNQPVVIVKDADLGFELFGLPIFKADGIIAWLVFKNSVIEIDYKNKLTTISKSVLQKSLDRNLFCLGYPIVTLRSPEGIPLNFGFDSGSQSTSIKHNIFRKIEVDRIENASGIVMGAGGSETVSKQRAYDVTVYLNDYRLDSDSVSTTQGVKGTALLKPDGKPGSNIGLDGKIIMDHLNGRFDLRLEK
ncbi:hypothetical protein GWO43_10215 [candidate division KSB1 bacterium]|nr:hypothetical protein [candidate division KSB1 bacterium]NIR69604.1 hypothetical protein [candidate division KSB1 bacterium]NIS24321.1 hypothetical protein [candidate division KSB1 bacterium]NIT71249.1 hypothetical protein [candidate division KSB1 bacterium]NIU24953.1 hypothetical protein [candidate division KSB1 bacterium]